MARRTVLTSRQRSVLFSLPQHEADLLRHYTLSEEDLQNIGARRRPRNKLGFALQLCVLRYPGRLLAQGEFVPPAVVDFIGHQLDLDGDELADYAVRSETRHEHLAELRRLYGFRSFSGGANSLKTVASQFSRSAPSSGRCFSPTRWWRPTTGSSAERIAKPHVPAKRSSGTKRPRSTRRCGRSPNWGRH